jgi:hypothetical protein
MLLAAVPEATLAQSGAHCTSGGSQSSFRVLQQAQAEQSAVTTRSQFSLDLAAEADSREVYGRQLMSERELKRYITKVDKYASTPEKQADYISRHREKMLARAKKRGIDPLDLEPEKAPASP